MTMFAEYISNEWVYSARRGMMRCGRAQVHSTACARDCFQCNQAINLWIHRKLMLMGTIIMRRFFDRPRKIRNHLNEVEVKVESWVCKAKQISKVVLSGNNVFVKNYQRYSNCGGKIAKWYRTRYSARFNNVITAFRRMLRWSQRGGTNLFSTRSHWRTCWLSRNERRMKVKKCVSCAKDHHSLSFQFITYNHSHRSSFASACSSMVYLWIRDCQRIDGPFPTHSS